MNNKIVYFVRHGQSEANVSPVFQDPHAPLTEAGVAQARLVAERAKNVAFDLLVSSPYARARSTAEAIQKATGKIPEFSDLFIERVKPSKVAGRPYTDPEALQLCREWEETLYTSGTRVEDGENFDDLVARADHALTFLERQNASSILVVSHGYFMRALFARVLLGTHLTGDALRSFMQHSKTENAGLSALTYDADSGNNITLTENSWRLFVFNDHAHLG